MVADAEIFQASSFNVGFEVHAEGQNKHCGEAQWNTAEKHSGFQYHLTPH